MIKRLKVFLARRYNSFNNSSIYDKLENVRLFRAIKLGLFQAL